eukprot:gi/632951600/ref/XP_007891392.1/ PREDICTED: pleckstrin homology domain-containing family G member 3-like [Callorhinchus milii]
MPEGSLNAPDEQLAAKESFRISTTWSLSSGSSNDRSPTVTASVSSVSVSTDRSDSDRPVSVSSSGSSQDARSLYGSNGALSASAYHIDCPHKMEEVDIRQCSNTGKEHGPFKLNRMCNNNNNSVSRPGTDGNFQQLPTSPIATRAMVPNPKLSYVDRVVMEIIETERMYVRDLRSIVEDYLGCIIDTPDLPTRPDQVSSLFGNIEDIYEFNSDLLQDLDSCNHDPVAVAKCFVDKSHYFEIYTQYCTNYPNSVAALTECMRNKILAKFFRERQATLKRSLPLGSYLLKPVQRILKYHLLLQEIAKHFDDNAEGYDVIEEAIDTMTGVAWYINDMKRKHEHSVRLQEVQSLLINWKGPDLTTYGELVLEGTFRIHRAKNERTLFLFDKVLLITKKRGEHFIYKSHITCSMLMLIESTRDSLYFGLMHYKNSKQQHTVQAKTVEEKRLWTHHIKRLILENHHAIIPQKAKEAILEMDSFYPFKYRYSPERLKKSMSAQEEIVTGRHGRRQSEPAKQILRSLTQNVSLKHAGSDGQLLGKVDSLSSMASNSTLNSSIGERPDNEEELALSKESLDQLRASDSDETARGTVLEQGAGELEEEDIMMEGDQVADFASTLLAAISCWHYRARALLSARFSTTENPSDIQEPKGFKRQHSESSGNPEKRMSLDTGSDVTEEVAADVEPGPGEEMVSDISQSSQVKTVGEVEPVQNPEEPTEGNEAADKIDHEISRSGSGVESTMDTAEEHKHFSSEESSDEEEQERHSPSILPPSVLDQASFIAGHFMNNRSRCNSLVMDDSRSFGCPTPKLTTSRRSSISSIENAEKLVRNSSASNVNDAFLEASAVQSVNSQESLVDDSNHSGQGDLLSEISRNIRRRMDSTLSRQDRLLIEKIKSYYEHAEHEDADFSIRRRESLSYIPTGLVRNSIFKLSVQNKDKDKDENVHEAPIRRLLSSSGHTAANHSKSSPRVWLDTSDPFTERSSRSSSPEPGNISDPQQTQLNDPAQGSPPSDGLRHAMADPQEHVAETEFRSSAEMIKIWQKMEKMSGSADGTLRRHKLREEVQSSASEAEVSECRSQLLKEKQEIEDSEHCIIKHLSNGRIIFGLDLNEPLVILEDSDLSAITEESPISSPARSVYESGNYERRSDRSEGEERNVTGEPVVLQEPAPPCRAPPHVQHSENTEQEKKASRPQGTGSQVTRKKHELPTLSVPAQVTPAPSMAQSEELLREVAEKMKSKVYQLARIYSQRIKKNKPVVKKRVQDVEDDPIDNEEERRTAIGSQQIFQEDKRQIVAAEKPKMTLSLPVYDRVIIHEQEPLIPALDQRDILLPNKDFLAFPLSSSSSRTSSPRHSMARPRLLSPVVSQSRSPLSPTEIETFVWPDVRELRSKYLSSDSQTYTLKTAGGVGHSKSSRFTKSTSVPNGMLENSQPHSSSACRSELSHSPTTLVQVPNRGRAASSSTVERGTRSHSLSQPPQQLRCERCCRTRMSRSRTASLDSRSTERCSSLDCKHCHFTSSNHYISSEITLQDDQKGVFMENLPDDDDEEEEEEADLSNHRKEQTDDDNSYVQIRSPTSREKISIRAVIERCKVYQESEEYKLREDGESQPKRQGSSVPFSKHSGSKGLEKVGFSTKQVSDLRKETSQITRSTELGQQGLVKNLRDRFQSLSSASKS